MDDALSRQLQKDFDSTCRVLFGSELGNLPDFMPYLSRFVPKPSIRKSHLSGNNVIVASREYSHSASFAALSELPANKSYSLSINEIKDLDSLLIALAEKCEYAGSRLLGNSAFAESSDIVSDSQYVLSSTKVERSSHVVASNMIRDGSKYAFGCQWFAKSEFMLQVHGAHTVKRAFDSYYITTSSDIYSSYSCVGCHDLMFSLGQRNARNMIGNLSLEKGKYLSLKGKLLSEIAERLRKGKGMPLLPELAPDSIPDGLPKISAKPPKDEHDLGIIRKGFASAYAVLFKAQPSHQLEDYKGWLVRNGVDVKPYKSAFGEVTYCPAAFCHMDFVPKKKLASVPEMLELGKIPMEEEGTGSLEGVLRFVRDNFLFTCEFYDGNNHNVNQTPCAYNAVNALGGFDVTNTDNSAYSSVALDSRHIYGGSWVLNSEFCIRCFDSTFLSRCLECDFCTKCADSYFCHNCEGLTDCMFCFNMKGARHCIGNTQLTREEYMKARDAILAKLADELDRTAALKMSIYTIGATGGPVTKV
jgi:hypothetical protein